jgi:hypothetical protein
MACALAYAMPAHFQAQHGAPPAQLGHPDGVSPLIAMSKAKPMTASLGVPKWTYPTQTNCTAPPSILCTITSAS